MSNGLKIAIDGRVLNDYAGKAVYTRSVLEAWKKVSDVEFAVYGYRPKEEWPSNWSFINLRSRLQRLTIFRHLPEDVLFSPSSYLTTILSNIPALTTIHDLIIYKVPVKLPLKAVISEKLLLKRAVRASQAITVQTQSVFDDLIDIAPRAKTKTHIIYPGVAAVADRSILPTEEEQKAALNRLAISKPFILFVGTLEPRKNLVRLIQAYEKLGSYQRDTYQLVLAGKVGWMDDSLEKQLNNLPGGVVVTGRVSDQDLACLYNRAKIVVYPSLYEGVGYPVLEGFYWKKPVITSNTSSMVEIGKGATRLIDPVSIPSIASAISGLLDNNKEESALIKAGQTRLEQFSWDKAARAYLEIFKEIQ